MSKKQMIERAANYGVGHLSSIRADMDGAGYSEQMRGDMDAAIALLKAGPALLEACEAFKNAQGLTLLSEAHRLACAAVSKANS